MHHKSVRITILVAVLSLLAAACGTDSSPAGSDGDTTSTTTAATTTTAPTVTTTSTVTTTTSPPPVPPAEPDGFGDPLPTPNPTIALPPDEGATFYQGVGFDLSLLGYEQSEYFISGSARSFANVGELTPDGAWTVEPADEADYASRIVVIRPSDPADFNGTVIMEWFNVSGGLDAAPNFTMSHVEQLRSGYAYVGVSAQFRGIEASPGTVDIGFPIFLKGIQPVRYESLSHPGDSFSYDIFNQAAQAVLSPVGIDPLGGLEIEQMIATGESQSAFRLTTYVNAIDPLAQLFDGFLIHSRGGGSSALSEEPQADISTPDQVLIREDVRVPVMTFQTDSDLLLLGWPPARQPDGDNIVTWEVAGTAHGDVYSISLAVGPQDLGNDPAIAEVVEVAAPIPGIIECSAPINSGPQHYVMNAAIDALNRWVGGGEPPPSAPRMEVVEREIDPAADGRQATYEAVTDEYGNILGGIRTAWVDVPVATLTGQPVEGGTFCGLFGTTTLFDDATLAALYPDKATYLDAMTASIERSVADGFILRADADLILENAADNSIGR
jgi:alpha/beta hydrolase family protein